MARDELAAWLRLLLTPGVGNETARKLLAAFGLPEAVFAQSPAALQTVVGARTAQALQQIPDELEPALERLQSWLAESDRHHLLSLGDARFPPELLQMADPPLLLYVLGDLQALSHPRKLAIVGSRNPTHQGAANAHQFARHPCQLCSQRDTAHKTFNRRAKSPQTRCQCLHWNCCHQWAQWLSLHPV